jgi:hypothetical protein
MACNRLIHNNIRKKTVLEDSSGNWNYSGIRISNPMRKKQTQLLYSNTRLVPTAAYSFAGFSSLASYSSYQQKQGTTTKKNHTSISLPATNEKTG